MDVVGQRFIFAVSQKPFETPSETGLMHHFCTVVPVFDSNGNRANPHDFPDNGDVWWKIQPGSRGLAEPGRLVTAEVEESLRKGERGKAQYQVVPDSLEPVRGRNFVEILDIPVTQIKQPRDLVRAGFHITLTHPPVDTVYVRWGDQLLGPFRSISRESERGGSWEIRFEPEASDSTCISIDKSVLDTIPPIQKLVAEVDVTTKDRPYYESPRPVRCKYLLVGADALSSRLPSDVVRISVQSDGQVVRDIARRFLSRSKRQELVRMLNELEDSVTESLADEERHVLDSVKTAHVEEVSAVQQLGDAIIKSGLLQSTLDEAIDRRVKEHLQDNAAKLQTELNKRVAETRTELEKLRSQRAKVEEEVEALKSQRLKQLERELADRRRQHDKRLKEDEERIGKQLKELERQQKVLSQNLEKVAKTLSEEHDQVVNQLLAIAPLLNRLGLIASPTDAGRALATDVRASSDAGRKADALTHGQFQLPRFESPASSGEISELEFFNRFKAHVEDCGFQYREIDLLAFHVSVKCGDLTVLGGPPGTGKSSLVRLYADAIHGDADRSELHRFLHIAVSPSWLDTRDLLGHVNALNRTFQPADSGLYEYLIYAQEEFKELASESQMYFACLDEMNLSHVEHYFSGLLQVLEHPKGNRILRCFPDHVVDPKQSFANWPTLQVPGSVRFIGTVNFDETTKQLSQRLLDRVNLIRLASEQLPMETEEAVPKLAMGLPIRLRDYESWVHYSPIYNDELASLIDGLREDLRTLNCPMNPRRFSAMRKFISSWPEDIASAMVAVDLQIAQRLLPQVRGLFQPGARSALESIRKRLEQHRFPFPESLRVIDEIAQNELSDLFQELEDAE